MNSVITSSRLSARLWSPTLIGVTLTISVLPGCYRRVVHDGWSDLRELAQQQQDHPQDPPSSPQTATGTSLPTSNNPDDPTAVSAYDLRTHTGMYTLQIGFYDQDYGPDFRQAAEQAVSALRLQGEEAYYYHGPHRSMVTLGLFTDAHFVQRGPVSAYGPEIEAIQKKYPYNLANGRTLVQKIDGQDIGQQESFLVRVP